MYTRIISVFCSFERFELSVFNGFRPGPVVFFLSTRGFPRVFLPPINVCSDFGGFGYSEIAGSKVWGAMGRMVVKNKSGDGKKLR